MKKMIFVLSLFGLLTGCGGGSDGGGDILASMQVSFSAQGGATTGHTLRIQSAGAGIDYTCSQNPTVTQPNHANCQLAAAGTGNQETPIIFNNLPTGQTYAFTEVQPNGGGLVSTNSCTVTIIDSATFSAPANPCTLGDANNFQLNLTFNMV